MKVYDFLLVIASQLGDARPGSPFRRYPLRDLVEFYNEAMCFVAAKRPDLFTDYTLIKLQTGSYQDARCCGCTNVLQVVGQVDAEGNTLKDLSASSSQGNSSKGRWYRAPCRDSAGGLLLLSATISPGMNGQFTVTPPVPAGTDMWVKVKCVHAPPKFDESGVLGDATNGAATTGDCKFLPAIHSYVMYRALQGDRHATGASSEAQNELRNVYTYLDLQYKSELAQETQ